MRMSAWASVQKKFDSFVNVLMPPDYEEEVQEEEAVQEEKVQPAARVQETAQQSAQKVVNGAPVYSEASSAAASPYERAAARTRQERPKLTVHTTKQPNLKVRIYAPSNFDQVTAIADDLKAGKATVVNYERIDAEEQRRICDFVNGVCYVLDGCAKRISEQIVLYVPVGVDVDEAVSVAVSY